MYTILKCYLMYYFVMVCPLDGGDDNRYKQIL